MVHTNNAVDLRPVALVLVGSLGIQASAVVSSTLFAELGTVAVSTFRLVVAAAIMLVAFRPAVRTFTRQRWINAGIYGIAMAAMNQFYFAAVERLPLGVVVTLDFLGPCLVSFLGLKRWRERGWAVVAFIGVVLIAGPSSGMDPVGLVYGFLAGAFFAAYTVFAERVGKAEGGGLTDLAISVAVAALVTLPRRGTKAYRRLPPLLAHPHPRRTHRCGDPLHRRHFGGEDHVCTGRRHALCSRPCGRVDPWLAVHG